MKLIIAGSRPPKDVRADYRKRAEWYDRHQGVVEQAIADSGFLDISEVVSGKAQGFDFLGEVWAAENHIPVIPFPADWERHGKSAGFIRNTQMAEYADALVAITYGTSGTRHMAHEMARLSKPHYVLDIRPWVDPAASPVTAGAGPMPAARNSGRSGSPAAPSARPSRWKTAGSGEAVSTLTLNRQGSEYPGQTGA